LQWFASPEIVIELALAVSAIWIFIIHMMSAEQPFMDPKLFVDRNFVTGCVFIFIIGIMLLATMALLPPLLQSLFGYPIVTVGLVLMPRGFGTMFSMLVVGRIIRLVDARLLILTGLLLTAASLWEMTRFTVEMGMSPIIISGVIQGLGLGLVFVPMSTIAFATLRPDLRTEGSSLFSLVRNIGSSIGISIVMALLAQNIQVNHSVLGQYINIYSQEARALAASFGLPVTSKTFLAVSDQLVTQQAVMISYLDDFRLMMYVALAAAPLLLFLKPPSAAKAEQGGAPGAAAVDAPH
jgi:MFS transporter, DHA2 family, multidrug resistance protein